MRWLAILNPAAGALRGRRQAGALATRLDRISGLTVHFTDGPGHAECLAAGAGAFDGLLAIGGDGTVAEVANGMDRRRQALTILAAGTGNGLARDLALAPLGREPEAALRGLAAAIDHGHDRWIDLIAVRFQGAGPPRRRLAVSSTGVGYVAEVVALARGRLAPLTRHLPPALCYPLGAALQAPRQRHFEIAWRLDAGPAITRRATNVMVQNSRHAGNFRAFPQADVSDGRLETLLADAAPWAQLRHNAEVLTRHYGYATAVAVPARSAQLRSRDPLRLMLDGEIHAGVTEVSWTVEPAGLRLVTAGQPERRGH